MIHNFHGTVSWVAHSTISQSLYNRGRVTIWTLVKTSLWWNDELRLKFDQPLRWTISYSMSFVFVGQDMIFFCFFLLHFLLSTMIMTPQVNHFIFHVFRFAFHVFRFSWSRYDPFVVFFFLDFLTLMMIKIWNYISATLRIWEAICWMAEGGSKKRCYCRSRKRARSAAKRFARGRHLLDSIQPRGRALLIRC